MAEATEKIRCLICNKEKATLKCGGCSQDFCYNHWDTHRQELNKQLDEIEMNRDLLRQSFTQQIDQWERNSIKIIQQTAEEARQILIKTIKEYIHQIEINLNKLTDQLRESHQENDINEINLRKFQEELDRLTKELTKPYRISQLEKIQHHLSIKFLLLCRTAFSISTKDIINIGQWKSHSYDTEPTRYWYQQENKRMGPGWTWHGIIFRAYSKQEPGTEPVYEYHSEVSGVWHNTVQMDPMPPVSDDNQWISDKVRFYCYKTSMGSEKLLPIRRYWRKYENNPDDARSRRIYKLTTKTEDEKQSRWIFDKILFYALPPEQ